jgi:hypothetical protein
MFLPSRKGWLIRQIPIFPLPSSLPLKTSFSHFTFSIPLIVKKRPFDYLRAERNNERRTETMNTILKERIEFNPQHDVLGKTIERNKNGWRQRAVLKGF